jgi:iron complex transport system ATP-binding protein
MKLTSEVKTDSITDEISRYFDYSFEGTTSFEVPRMNIRTDFGIGLIVGASGSGKSTLLKTLTGYLKPLHGSVLIQGENLASLSFEQKASLISIVTTEKIGGFNLTVYDVVALGRTPYLSVFGKLMPDDIAIIERSLERLGLASLKNIVMEELSDGQRQKVMIAKSLAQETPIILLDEPTAFLDYRSKHKLFEDLKTLCTEEQKLIMVSSHDIDLMQKYMTKALYLKENNLFEVK